MVGRGGVEPPWIAPLDSKSNASASFAIYPSCSGVFETRPTDRTVIKPFYRSFRQLRHLPALARRSPFRAKVGVSPSTPVVLELSGRAAPLDDQSPTEVREQFKDARQGGKIINSAWNFKNATGRPEEGECASSSLCSPRTQFQLSRGGHR